MIVFLLGLSTSPVLRCPCNEEANYILLLVFLLIGELMQIDILVITIVLNYM